MINQGRWSKIKKEEIRCKGTYRGEPCKRRLFDGSPGFEIMSNRPKEQDIICPRCGAKNLVSSDSSGKVTVRLKE